MIRKKMNRTTTVSGDKIERKWYVVDADGLVLGRLAQLVAKYLNGKEYADFSPNLDRGANVIVLNSEKIVLTKAKATYTYLQRYSGYPSGLKKQKVSDLLKTKPERVIEHAVKGMLKNVKYRDQMMARLHCIVGPDHKHEAQKPVKITL